MRTVLLVVSTCLAMSASAAASRVLVPDDRNLGISVQDAHSRGNTAQLVYYTFPTRGQPHAAAPCSLNLYQLPLTAGPEALTPRVLAQNYCGSRNLTATVLDDGDVVVVSGKRVDVLRPGAGTVASWPLEQIDALEPFGQILGTPAAPHGVARNGDIVVAATVGGRERKRYPSAAAIAVGLTATGQVRWRAELEAASVRLTIMQAVATRSGGALLLVRALPDGEVALPVETADGTLVTDEVRVYRIAASGEVLAPFVVAQSRQADMQQFQMTPEMQRDPAAVGRMLRSALAGAATEDVRSMLVHETNAGVDLLLDRSSNDAARDGAVLLRVGATGGPSETSLNQTIERQGLARWADFYVTDDQVVLLGLVSATQPTAPPPRNRTNQNALMWFDLPKGPAVTRLLPLDTRYVLAALQTPDEQFQYLRDLPGGEPQRLTHVGTTPIAVALGRRNGRQALLVDEGAANLPVYAEHSRR